MKNLYWPIMILVTVVAIAYGLSKFTFLFENKETSKKTSSMEQSFGNDVKELYLEAALLDVKIKDGDEFNVEYKGMKELEPECVFDEANKTLKITQKDKRSSKLSMKIDNKLTITIPKGHGLKVFELELACGNVDIDDLKAEELTVTDNLGNVKIKEVKSGKIKLEANMGDINLEECDCKDVEIAASMGNVKVKMEDDIEDYAINANASLGNITIDSEDHTGSYVQTGSEGKIVINCSMGNVEIKD